MFHILLVHMVLVLHICHERMFLFCFIVMSLSLVLILQVCHAHLSLIVHMVPVHLVSVIHKSHPAVDCSHLS